jgi:hypothetical protein
VPAAAALAATRRGRRLILGCSAVYAAACAVAGVRAGAGEPLDVRARVPAMFVVLHVAWGLGFWTGVVEAVRQVDVGGGSPPRLPLAR